MYRIQSKTLSGQLRAEMARRWSESDEVWPSERVIWRNIMKGWRLNPHAGQIDLKLFRAPPIHMIDYDQTLSGQTIRRLLRTLKTRMPFHCALSEAQTGEKETKGLVCLIFGVGESTYTAFVMSPENDSKSLQAAQVAIIPAVGGNGCKIEMWTNAGWEVVAPDVAMNYPEVKIVLLTLARISGGSKIRKSSPKNLKFNPDIPTPPHDEVLIRALVEVGHGKNIVTHAEVPFTLIRAKDTDYLQKLSKMEFPTFPVGVRMTLYWDGTRFVMSDDYALYLQHLKDGSDTIPAAIIGTYPTNLADPTRIGGAELVPPLIQFPSYKTTHQSENDELWLLREKLRQKDKKPFPNDDMAVWLMFAKLLATPDVPEKSLHDFLLQFPVLLSEFGSELKSEVSLGGKFRIDLVASRTGAMPQVTLIELEHAGHQLLTQSGQEGAAVTHAVQQVSDWLRWWRTNSDHPLVKPNNAVTPQGLVVIGRTFQLTKNQILTLAHNNQMRHGVKVISYDQLLDKLEEHLLSKIDDEPPPA